MSGIVERRRLLRAGAEGKDPSDLDAIRNAFAAVDESDRAALARTLPASRLLTAEGRTPRSCFLAVATLRPASAADAIVPRVPWHEEDDATRSTALARASILAAVGRDSAWRDSFVDSLATRRPDNPVLVWTVCSALVHEHGVPATSTMYLRCFIRHLGEIGEAGRSDRDRGEQGRLMADHLLAHPTMFECEFLALFAMEGMGSDYTLTEWAAETWDALVVRLAADPEMRRRMLDESLAALLRDFSMKDVLWYLRVHRLLAPEPEEIAARQQTYLSVLTTAPSTAVSLAQEMLSRIAGTGAFDAAGLLEVSDAVLLRKEKKLVKAQLSLLTVLAGEPQRAERISALVGGVVGDLAPDLARSARGLLIADAASEPVRPGRPIPVPVVGPRPSSPRPTVAIAGADEYDALLAAHLEGGGDGADIPRLRDYAASHPHAQGSAAVRARAEEVLDGVWDRFGVSPRRHLAAALLGRPSEDLFRGYGRYVVLGEDEEPPAGMLVEQTTAVVTAPMASAEEDPAETWSFRSGYLFLATDAPSALLVEEIARGGDRELCEPVPARTREWARVLREPGEGMFSRDREVLVRGEVALWTDVSAPDALPRVLDVSKVAEEFTFRAQEGRDQDGCEQIVQWAAWALSENPDTLAAHFHPLLYAAAAVVNVRGVGALLAALGEARSPGRPTWSALALTASAKTAEHRAHAAEALSLLARNGVLDVDAFAREIAAHLEDGFVLPGRVAQTLADAASIDALTGYRVLQLTAALLPHVLDDDARPRSQAGRLVELAARLSDEFGTPIAVPPALEARGRGGSALAVAVRALDAVVPRGTDSAQDAADIAAGEGGSR